jgi:hypothetical protein
MSRGKRDVKRASESGCAVCRQGGDNSFAYSDEMSDFIRRAIPNNGGSAPKVRLRTKSKFVEVARLDDRAKARNGDHPADINRKYIGHSVELEAPRNLTKGVPCRSFLSPMTLQGRWARDYLETASFSQSHNKAHKDAHHQKSSLPQLSDHLGMNRKSSCPPKRRLA